MVNRITHALELPAPKRYIHIEEVARPEEIRKASEARHKEGKHVIPVPTMELKPHFKGYLLDSLKFLRYRKKGKMGKKLAAAEKSVVRPVFSYYGKLVFADEVFRQLVSWALQPLADNVAVHDVSGVKSEKQANGLILKLSLQIKGARTPDQMKAMVSEIRNYIQTEIEYTTGMSVETIKIKLVASIAR